MIRALILLSTFVCFSATAESSQWEYQVVFLPGAVSGAEVSKQPHGGYLDSTKTRILNELANQGWELISVTGQSGADHAAYLRKKK